MAPICFLAGMALGLVEPRVPKADPFQDVGVCYISRTPRYDRYVVTDDGVGPLYWYGGAKNPKGQQLTYTAKLLNSGDTGEAFDYKISLDGTVLKSGSSYLGPNQSTTVSVKAVNAGTRQKLTVEVFPASPKDPAINNTVSIATDAFAIRFVVDPYVYIFYHYYKDKYASPYGTLAFEDWAQKQVEGLNTLMENRGATTRVFLDSVETAPNNLYSRSYADSTGHDATFIAYLAYFNPVNGLLNYYDPLTLLLLGRSIGLTYDAQYSLDAANNPVSGLQYYPPASLLFYGTQAPWISEHDRDALNLTAKYRRGFIGEYQFDIPENLSVKILDTVGNPMPNQKVDVFQTAIAGGLTTEPIFSGTTDAAGVLALPNRAVSRRDTPTGHKLKPNPFGQVDPYGRNGLLHFRVKTPIRYNFAWLPLSRVNTAFWKGATKKATLPIVAYRFPTGIAPVPTQQEVRVDAGKTYTGVFTINTGVIKSQVAASVVQGQNYLSIAKPEGIAPYRVKYTVDATTLAKGTYDAYILLHDWSQGTNDYLFYVKVIVQ